MLVDSTLDCANMQSRGPFIAPPERFLVMSTTIRCLTSLMAVAALAACAKPQTHPTTAFALPPLATLTVAPERAREEQSWDGVVEAIHQATLSAQTAGRVVELPYDVNDFVQAGAVLVRFTDVEQRSRAAAARRRRASARPSYDEAAGELRAHRRNLCAQARREGALDQAVARTRRGKGALDSAEAALREAASSSTTRSCARRIRARHQALRAGRRIGAGRPAADRRRLARRAARQRQVPQSAVDAIRRFDAADVLLEASARRSRPRSSRSFRMPIRQRTRSASAWICRREHRPLSRHDRQGRVRDRRGGAAAGARTRSGSRMAK